MNNKVKEALGSASYLTYHWRQYSFEQLEKEMVCDNENFIRIQIRHNTLAYKALKDMLAKYIIGKDDECEYHSTSYRVPKSEFEKEEL